MKESPPTTTKEKQQCIKGSIPISDHLEWYLNNFCDGFKKDYPSIGERWLADQTDYIKVIAETEDIETCVDYIAISNYGHRMIIDIIRDHPFKNIEDQSPAPWEYRELVRIADSENWEDMKRSIDERGPAMMYLGYFAISAVIYERLDIDMAKNKTRSAFLLRHEELISDDPIYRPFIDESYQQLRRYARKKYNDIEGKTNYKPYHMQAKEGIDYYIGRLIVKRISKDVRTGLIDSVQDKKKIRFIPENAAQYLRRENKPKPIEKDKDPIFEDEDYYDSLYDISSIIEISQQLNSIKDPTAQKILQLKHLGLKNVDIAAELGIHRNTVRNNLKKYEPQI